MKSIAGLLCLLLISLPVVASEQHLLDSMHMPAWYDHEGVTKPLAPGVELHAGDAVRTGDKGRATLRMSEGSLVKLGTDSSFEIERASTQNNVFEGLLSLTRGAFRFTTSKISQRGRNIDVNLGAVTIGIRGTDIWGRSGPDGELFALLEGEVEVRPQGEAAFNMSEAMTFITRKAGEATSPIQRADEATVNSLAQETEMLPGTGLLTVGGNWAVVLMSLQDIDLAVRLQSRLHTAGYAAEIETTDVDNKVWNRVRIDGFASRADAQAFSNSISGQLGINSPWLTRVRR